MGPEPESFNDPFDTNTDNYLEELSLETIENIARNGFPQIKNINPSDHPAIVRTLHEGFVKQAMKFGILSMTEDCGSTLMWAHYANGHRGFCMEFGRTLNSLLGDHAWTKPVSYWRLCPVLDNKNQWDQYLEAFGPDLEQLIFVKAEEWRYEREWRSVYRSVNCLADYPGPLKSIIWGLCMDEKDKVKIRASAERSNVIFKQAKTARGEFRIAIDTD